MALVADIFNQNAWGAVEVQEEIIERVAFKPQLLGTLNLFSPIYSRSRVIGIADTNGVLTLIPTSANGAPPEELIPKGAKIRTMEAVRLAKGSTIYAIELAGVLALPFDEQTVEVADEVTSRTGQIKDDLELTWEHMRFGAVQGKVIDADGATVLVDWFEFWGIDEPEEVNFALNVETTDVRKKCRDIKRAMQKAAKGAWTPGTKVGALVGDEFFDLLVNHKQIKETKLGTEKAPTLENIEGYSSIEIEGIVFINYQGTDDGTTIAIGSEKARFFPIGARNAFQVGWAPASEFKPYLNKRGQEFYGLVLEDKSGRDEWDRVELYSYPLFICTRPEMLRSARAK
ncbi:major capsid protein [Rhizobium sp. LC145]|uniref:major capsid protein n=1 Tax=Rhizobium sp. LC145 TaxID=1120688 RepID=UPI000629E12D|nr:major capsid protein [Rhizobium sp. LC145]KKX24319.1 phage protein GP20 [Rhizobium sp. LC145]TKT46190.1 major capsid protein [Rhizobiaceae bacterium LC148]